MKKLITSILLMLFMGCSNNVTESAPISECLECGGVYHFDDNGFCICD